MWKAQYWVIAATFLFSVQSIGAQELPSFSGGAYRALLRVAYAQFERFAGFLAPSKIRFLADGGGDGGGGDGGGDGSGSSGDGGSSGSGDGSGAAGDGDSSSSSSSTGDGGGASASDSDSDSASDAVSAAAAATSDDAAAATDAATNATATDDNNNNNNNNAITVTPAPTDPEQSLNNAVTPELAAIMAIPTTDPRGGFSPSDVPANELPELTIPAGGFPPPGAPPENVEIHAVIISAAESPWDAIERAPGVGTVTVVGGIVALGKTPIPGETPGGGPQPPWLRLIPDLRLLNGSMIPPVVPNIIDIRWLNCPIQVNDPNPVEDPKP